MAKRTGRMLVIAGVVVVVAGGVVVWTQSASSSPAYRTAVAGPAVATSTLDTTGTVAAISEATLSFPVNGQVSTISVQVGQQVGAGQTLAQLDSTPLAGQLASAQSTLATAQAKLAADESGQTSAAGPGHMTTAAYLTSSPQPPDLAAQQQAVVTAQKEVDADLNQVKSDLAKQQQDCQPVLNPASTPPPSQEQVSACTADIGKTQTDQQKTASDERTLADAENTLSQTLANDKAPSPRTTPPSQSSAPAPRATPLSSSSPPTRGSSSGGQASGRSSAGGQGSSAGGAKSTTPVSAEQLAADQASIDAANAQVAVAQQNLAAATLVSPIAGTVGEIDFTTGRQATSQQHIVVFGPGSNEVTTAVSDAQAGQVKPGQRVTVTPDGSGTPLSGQVTSVGMLSSMTSSSGTPSYPVTVSLPDGGPQLYQGATASVSIITGTADAAVTVPTSAVHLLGSVATVTTVANGQTRVRRVTVGVIGPSVTEITSGLTAGEQVLLADLSQPLPTSNTNGVRGLVGGGGGAARRTRAGG
ncbi:HlyD family efflux transporter periplasmic adaptor subunit [Amycolatopsis thermophila]|uniref:HlyD family secretion protein n=1 Tax=Amycolatopsis thermophila TaxID=206084 RepID=A0ABU0F6B4_9PSEU|nr:HlyD family efflux transporter periplasmic adaptor subunit [Amycolatopsis thermophila]MDQ0382928.1 HlyD family secretion protein [Amycolatopsis thermophila]